MKQTSIFMLFFLLFASCSQRQETITPPWTVSTSEGSNSQFDLSEIQQAGELIGVTLIGPDTYYGYQGRHLGAHYLLGEQFASELGVKLRMETCRDTSELRERLTAGDADIIIMALDTTNNKTPGWVVGPEKPLLEEALNNWYKPDMLAQARLQEKQLLSRPRVQRRVHAPMLSHQVISRYDGLFRLYGRRIGWDWRLLAAQCYQESTFDPEAQSWAGAKGLMQIMPATADHLGLPRDEITNPEKNIEAATRLLKELEGELSFVHNYSERQNLALASYNGGLQHIRDAMRLAERDGRNPQVWSDVKEYVLRLSDPKYYQDSLVQSGYMRGKETAEYVDQIRLRYMKYKQSVR